jgi:predicted esterase
MPIQEGPAKQTIRSVGACLVLSLLILAMPATLVAVFLLLDAETWNGRLFAAACLVLYSGTCAHYLWLKKGGRVGGQGALALSALALSGFAACYTFSPSGVTSGGSKLQSVFPPGRHYARWTPVGLVPEMDQTKVGAHLTPYSDPLMTRAKAERMKTLFLTAYREMQQDPEFVAVGSVMGHAYADAFGFPFNGRHLFSYIPTHKPGQKLPVVLFLHGSCGNFKAYLWTWKRFADDHQIAIVAPTFGFGIWSKPGGMEAIDWACSYCTNHSELDAGRIVLVGLSNGGIGVSRAVCQNSGRLRGLIYISGVMEGDVMASPSFIQGCKGKSVLVIHGDQDERIPLKYVEQTLAGLTGTAVVKTKYYANEDHFLFLSRRDEVLEDVFNSMAPW